MEVEGGQIRPDSLNEISQKVGIFFIVLITIFFLNNCDNCKFNIINFLLFKKHDVVYCKLNRNITKLLEETFTGTQI